MKKPRLRLGLFLALMVLGTASCGLFVETLPNGKVPQPDRSDHFMTIDGVRYHYTEYPGQGEDVFLLYGLASSAYTLFAQLSVFMRERHPAANKDGFVKHIAAGCRFQKSFVAFSRHSGEGRNLLIPAR